MMFFSTDTNNLPRDGELVCIRGSINHERPYRVTGRTQDGGTGQVYIDAIDIITGQAMERCKVEVFSYWPMQGDTAVVIIGPYLDWLVHSLYKPQEQLSRIQMQQLHFSACQQTKRTTEQLMQKHLINMVEGHGANQMAAVTNESGRQFKCPCRVLAVLKKADTRTDSRSERVKQMSLLT